MRILVLDTRILIPGNHRVLTFDRPTSMHATEMTHVSATVPMF